MPQPSPCTQDSAWRCSCGCLSPACVPLLSPQTAGWAPARGAASPWKEGCSSFLFWAAVLCSRTEAVLCPHTVQRALPEDHLCSPNVPSLSGHQEGHSQLVGFGLELSVRVCVCPRCSVSDPRPRRKPHSLSQPSETPAFLAKRGSSTHVGECGCDATSTGHLSPAALACSQLSPALLPEPAGMLKKWRRKRRSHS